MERTMIHAHTCPVERVVALDCAFISADYTLIPSGGATCHNTLEDIKDLFTFLANTPAFQFSQGIFRIDPSRIAVAGPSAGGLCAYWAAMHAVPKPKAVLAMYPMGGDFLVSIQPASERSAMVTLCIVETCTVSQESPLLHGQRAASRPGTLPHVISSHT